MSIFDSFLQWIQHTVKYRGKINPHISSLIYFPNLLPINPPPPHTAGKINNRGDGGIPVMDELGKSFQQPTIRRKSSEEGKL